MSEAKPLALASQRLCRRLWEDGWGARRMALALSRRGMEEGDVASLIKRVLRWRKAAGLPARWQSIGRPPKVRASTAPVPAHVVDARIDAALRRQEEQHRAELAVARRRCECGGIIAPGIEHRCQRTA